MRSARLLISVLALSCGVAAGAVLLPRALHNLRALTFPTLTAPRAEPPPAGSSTPGAGHSAGHGRRGAVGQSVTDRQLTTSHPAKRAGSLSLLEVIRLELVIGFVLIGAVATALFARRAWQRRTRAYGLYELHLSTHDEAKRQDLEDMVESIANIVRAWPADRARNGQPYFALELICGTVDETDGYRQTEWSINVRCRPESVTALDGALSAAYPDIRLGRMHGGQPRPRPGALREPGYVMRFRKERSFVYSLIADGEQEASSPLEQIARAQVAQDAPSLVRFQLTPTPSSFEELARRLYRRHENKLVRQERFGLPEGGLLSTFNRAEMRAAERTQNRSLFWLETVVAADSSEVCKAIGAAVQSRRGENRLHRRWMIARQRLYRRRFPRALGPLIPSFRCLVSAAEVSHLLELPSARMKGVPVRRLAIPRIPAPPEIVRGNRARPAGPVASDVTQPAIRVASTAIADMNGASTGSP